MTATPQTADPFHAHFARRARQTGAEPEALRAVRRRAFERYETLGWPTTRLEDWMHTHVAPMRRVAFAPPERAAAPPPRDMLDTVPLAGLDAHRRVFFGGRAVAAATEGTGAGAPPEGVHLEDLAVLLARDDPRAVTPLLRESAFVDHPFAALNTALFAGGAFVHVDEGVHVEKPIVLVHVADGRDGPRAAHPRHWVTIEAEARATLVEIYAGVGDAPGLTNARSELTVGPGARVHHVKVQVEQEAAFHLHAFHLRLARDAVFHSHAIHLGAALSRNDLVAHLDGEDVWAALNGLYVLGEEQRHDSNLRVEHARPRGESHELYKGIVAGHARGAFRGRIHVHRAAQKTDAYQSNRNLLLSKDATCHADPQLEIYADDVKCSHGATVGQLDENALFYLRARGISETEARAVLVEAFAREVLDGIDCRAVRHALERRVGARLRALVRADAGASS